MRCNAMEHTKYFACGMLTVMTDFGISKNTEHNSYEDIPWINRLVEFTQHVLAQDRVRIVGVCFGHQILGRALGVKVGQSDQGWEIAVCDMDLTEKGKEVFGLEKIVRDAFIPFRRHMHNPKQRQYKFANGLTYATILHHIIAHPPNA